MISVSFADPGNPESVEPSPHLPHTNAELTSVVAGEHQGGREPAEDPATGQAGGGGDVVLEDRQFGDVAGPWITQCLSMPTGSQGP